MATPIIKKATPVVNPKKVETPVTRTVKGKTIVEKTDNPGADSEEKRAQKAKELENEPLKSTQEDAANQEVHVEGE